MDLKAEVTLSRRFKLPLAKLSISGSLEAMGHQPQKTPQRAIVFVIDRSYSMYGNRLKQVKEALKPFVESICEDINVVVRLVLFCDKAISFHIPRDKSDAGDVIEKRLFATGGTDFHKASQHLVGVADGILNDFPTYQLTVIMCSDGEVGKLNARKGHDHWKDFVTKKYLKIHSAAPYVETIGISSQHDADVLSGFIFSDAAGNYCHTTTPEHITDAFARASSEAMQRTASKISVELPLGAYESVYNSSQIMETKRDAVKLFDIFVTSDTFEKDFWVSMNDIEAALKRTPMEPPSEFDTPSSDEIAAAAHNKLYLQLDGKVKVPIDVIEVSNEQQCQTEAILFYHQVLKDMLHTLRSITDAALLKKQALTIETEMKEYDKTFTLITEEPAAKQDLVGKIKALLDEVNPEARKKRAELMQLYKKMNAIWKTHRKVVTEFSTTASALKTLVREIVVGKVRIQEIRQHILDLHFRKTHAKRINKLILTDEQLEKRQEMYEDLEPPKAEDVSMLCDELGSGCYLSTFTFKECAEDGEAVWLCGFVRRSGGAAVSNPELINIDYVSVSDLVSGSYFNMAIEAKPDGFVDSSRQIINARIFPIYGNAAHMKVSKPYLNESLSHCLSGRVDIRVVDWNCLFAVLGHMIGRTKLSTLTLKRIFEDMLPSLELLCSHSYTKPFKEFHIRETDPKAPRIPLLNKSRIRLQRYAENMKCRTTAWVSNASVLYTDKLLHSDIELTKDFWLSLVLQRLRQMVGAQYPKSSDDVLAIRKIEKNHNFALQILICGSGNANEKPLNAVDEKSGDDGVDIDFTYATGLDYHSLFALAKMEQIDPATIDMSKWNAKQVLPSMIKICAQLFGRISVGDVIQAYQFFDCLENQITDCQNFESNFERFKNIKVGNDISLLFKVMSNDSDDSGNTRLDFNCIRAMCAVALATPTNKSFQKYLDLFDGKLFSDPIATLHSIYESIVIQNMKDEYRVYLEQKQIEEMRYKHSHPYLPDDIDEMGNLPYLKCGWTKCGMIFYNRDKLLEHVARCIEHRFLHRFHLHCRSVLEPNPQISFAHFCKKVKPLFGDKVKHLTDDALKVYYDQFQPIFTKL